MKILNSEFVTSVFNKNQYPKRVLNEIAIVGRSNVGKSSLINYLLGRKIAKTSSTPGKTKSLNYFLINDNFYIVDLPGYGYAKVSKKEQEEWQKFLSEYITTSKNIKLLVLLVDIRHELKDNDADMIEFIKYYQLPCVIALTKADKLKSNELQKQIAYYSKIELEIPKVVTSAEKGLGKNELVNLIGEYL
ncbi:MAG: ribosome biogenesis GTP-binding protein YihA/YsxC [Candidatus Sericytochromatia bacterium]